MATVLEKKKWEIYSFKSKQMLLWGLKNKKVFPYGEALIEKLRNISYGGVPASIILLSNGMCNGYCYDRAHLMSKAFIDDEDVDIKLVYATIDSLKLNPLYNNDEDPLYADHCFVEISDKDGEYVIDTSAGFIFEKKFYYMMEHPKVRHVNNKEKIIEFCKFEHRDSPEDIERDKYALPAILPFIEMTYGRPNEMYSMLGIEMLQNEINIFKKKINYDDLVKEVSEDMKLKGFKRGL